MTNIRINLMSSDSRERVRAEDAEVSRTGCAAPCHLYGLTGMREGEAGAPSLRPLRLCATTHTFP